MEVSEQRSEAIPEVLLQPAKDIRMLSTAKRGALKFGIALVAVLAIGLWWSMRPSSGEVVRADDLVNELSDWEISEGRGFMTLVLDQKAMLTVILNGPFVELAIMQVAMERNKEPRYLSDLEVEPVIQLLSLLFPDWAERGVWLRKSLTQLPPTPDVKAEPIRQTRGNWELTMKHATITAGDPLPPWCLTPLQAGLQPPPILKFTASQDIPAEALAELTGTDR